MTKNKNKTLLKAKSSQHAGSSHAEYQPLNSFSPNSNFGELEQDFPESLEDSYDSHELQEMSGGLNKDNFDFDTYFNSDLGENSVRSDSITDITSNRKASLNSKKNSNRIIYCVCSIFIVLSLALGVLDTAYANLNIFPSVNTSENNADANNKLNSVENQISQLNSESQFFLRIIHTNDLHSKLDSFGKSIQGESCYLAESKNKTDCFGGLAKVKTVIEDLKLGKGIKKSIFNHLVLDAGDQIQGSYYYSYFKGKATRNVIKNMGFEVMTVGNHEFDDGPSFLADYLKYVNIPVVSANMKINKTAEPDLYNIIKPYTIIDRYKLGIIGLTTNNTAWTSSSGPNVVFTDMVNSVNDSIDKLHAAGIKRIMLLSHIGYQIDKKLASLIKPGVSVIVGAHSHTFLYSGKDPKVIGENKVEGNYPTLIKNTNSVSGKSGKPWSTYIVQSKCWGEYVGYLDVVFDEEGRIVDNLVKGEPVRIHSGIKDHPGIKAIVDKYQSQLYKYINTAIGHAAMDIPLIGNMTNIVNQDNSSSLIKQESQMGNLVSMALMSAAKLIGHKSIVNFSIISSGMVKVGFNKGEIKRKHIMKAVPFNNPISYAVINGKTLVNALNGALSGSRNNSTVRGFVYFDGLRANFTQAKPTTKNLNLFQRLINTKNSPNSAGTNNVIDKLFVRKTQYTMDGLIGSFSSEDRYKVGAQIEATDWEPVDLARNYTFATIDFVANGGDNIFFKNEILRLDKSTSKNNFALRDVIDGITNPPINVYLVLESYFRLMSPLYPVLDGRFSNGTLFD
ncbi:5'-nucleotidase [Smittium culicis]|uniref:5'-nucleotidase n=1 Tax=Smittium culicis TaxID=133412 RepID=A0A1R1XPG3_9FUNG|nr:5'-nucleotidase [Smittium culicis]OMJ16465.1 5'-nucleotidase [Smittium culicis]OMJ17160.1 5'-nucleotidase [Smittium culicis]